MNHNIKIIDINNKILKWQNNIWITGGEPTNRIHIYKCKTLKLNMHNGNFREKLKGVWITGGEPTIRIHCDSLSNPPKGVRIWCEETNK